jgi:single-stranded-DNA-specific exonuclease
MGERYQWKQAPAVPTTLTEQFAELPSLTVQMLSNRGITTQEAVDQFLQPDYGQDQHDPYLFRDMQTAVDRIIQAVDKQEKVVVHGDYDADGVCASAVLYKTLKGIGLENVGVYLPHRDTEGYGLNMNTVQKLADQKTDLIITVDCGISNHEEVTAATEKGIDVIVTDHHSQPPVLPDDAIAVINPKLDDLGEAFEKWLLDLVAISTVTDFVELIDENRVLLKYGLMVLQKNRRPGVKALLSQIGVEADSIDADTIGFKIGPHINAAGRVNHANVALELLLEENDVRAKGMSEELSRTNKARQSMSRKMSAEAVAQAEQQKEEYVIIVESEDWPVGLVGLVAGHVASKYNRPTFVITTMGGEIVGSGRSIEHFHLVEGLQSMDELFSKYGGHPMACGFSLKDADSLEAFKERMRARAKELLDGKDLRNTIDIEAELSLKETDWELIDTVNQLAPYGQANPKPVFVSRGVRVDDFALVGKTESHLRMTISQDGTKRKCIGFNCAELAGALSPGAVIDIAYHVSVNEWNGNREIQLEIKDIGLQ